MFFPCCFQPLSLPDRWFQSPVPKAGELGLGGSSVPRPEKTFHTCRRIPCALISYPEGHIMTPYRFWRGVVGSLVIRCPPPEYLLTQPKSSMAVPAVWEEQMGVHTSGNMIAPSPPPFLHLFKDTGYTPITAKLSPPPKHSLQESTWPQSGGSVDAVGWALVSFSSSPFLSRPLFHIPLFECCKYSSAALGVSGEMLVLHKYRTGRRRVDAT